MSTRPRQSSTRHLSEITKFTTHMSPRWGFSICLSRVLYTYRPAGALICVDSVFLYTLRSAGAQVLIPLAFYRHIAPLERKREEDNYKGCPHAEVTLGNCNIVMSIFRAKGMKKAVFPCSAEENGFSTSAGKQAFVPFDFLIRSGGVYF